SGIAAREEVVRLLAHASAHLAARPLDERGRIVARQGWKCTREDEGFSCEDLRLRSIAGGRGWFDAEMDQFTDHCPVPRLVEVREDSLRHRLADASDH